MLVSGSDIATTIEKSTKRTGMNKLLELFYDIDDSCSEFIHKWYQQLIAEGQRKRQCANHMTAKELIFFDRAMLSNRFIIEIINGQLKNI